MAKGIYTDDRVVTEYRQAKDKRAQIAILAELQQCSEREIEELLRSRGALETDEDRIRELHDQGMSQRQVAETLGISRETVRWKSKLMGLEWERKPGSRGNALTAYDKSRIAELAASGHTAAEIADELGRIANTVRVFCKKEGITLTSARGGGVQPAAAETARPSLRDTPHPSASPTPSPQGEGTGRHQWTRTRPLGFDDRIEAVRFMSALFGAAPEKCSFDGELITATFPNGMFQLHACVFDKEAAS